MENLFQWITTYGYAGLSGLLVLGIVGVPVPDETLLVFCGYLIWKGDLTPHGTWLAGFAGSATGITISYLIGRSLGYGFVHRYGRYVHLTDERLHRVEQWFERIGHWFLMVGYFIPGVRHFTALVAGMSRLPFREFVLFAYPGAALWVTAFLTLGYLLGDKWKAAFATIHEYSTIVIISIVLIAIVIWWWHRRKGNRSST